MGMQCTLKNHRLTNRGKSDPFIEVKSPTSIVLGGTSYSQLYTVNYISIKNIKDLSHFFFAFSVPLNGIAILKVNQIAFCLPVKTILQDCFINNLLCVKVFSAIDDRSHHPSWPPAQSGQVDRKPCITITADRARLTDSRATSPRRAST